MKLLAKDYITKNFLVQPGFKRFDQKNDIYNRAYWDKTIDPKDFFKSYDTSQCIFQKSEGFTQWDFAIRNSGWHLADFACELKEETEHRREGFTDYYTIQTKGAFTKAELKSLEETTKRIKKAATFLGANAVGVCELDKRWIYSNSYSRTTKESKPVQFPAEIKFAVIIAVPMDYELSKTYPSSLGGAATGLGYTHDLVSLVSLAQFIRNLGYNAIASLNDTALSIPMAIQAGVGEYGRHGLLITKNCGPRVRLGKVFTDIPLVPDKPIEFGVKKFCEICKRCTQSCPANAITSGDPQSEPPTLSNLKNVTKWTINTEKCFKFWVSTNTECSVCIRVCPYNKDYSKNLHKLGINLAGSFLRRLVLQLDTAMGYGKKMKPDSWWNKK